MSLKIDPSRLASGKLTDTEYKILQDQSKLPAHLPFRPELAGPPGAVDLDARANTGTVNTANLSIEELQAELDRRKAEETTPDISDKGGIVNDDEAEEEAEEEEEEEEEEDYGDGWTNDQRRVELASRGLSVDGTKVELIARLLRSDKEQLVEGDLAATE